MTPGEPGFRAVGFGDKRAGARDGAGKKAAAPSPPRKATRSGRAPVAAVPSVIPAAVATATLDVAQDLARLAAETRARAARLDAQIAEAEATAARDIHAITDPRGAVQTRALAERVEAVARARGKWIAVDSARKAARAVDAARPETPEACAERIDQYHERMSQLVEPGVRSKPRLLWWTFPHAALRDFFTDLRAVEQLMAHHHRQARQRIERLRDRRVAQLRRDRDKARSGWLARCDELRSAWEAAAAAANTAQPPLTSPVWDALSLPEVPRRFVRIGTARYLADDAPWTMPVLWHCPSGPSLVLQSARRTPGMSQRMVALITRILAGLPAGSAEVTLIDPVGLTDTFSPLMHLRDYDKALLGERVLVESRDIEQFLEDMTRHIALVTASYLGGSFKTLEEHNAHAGTVVTPYRVVAIADFPERFTAEAIKRLVTIAGRGPAAGVILVLNHDCSAELPYGADVRPLLDRCLVAGDRETIARPSWDSERPVTAHSLNVKELDGYALEADDGLELRVDSRATATRFGRILEAIGTGTAAARESAVSMTDVLADYRRQIADSPARHEDVPPMPDPADPRTWWRGSTEQAIVVPLGPAGARSTQTLVLGRKRTTEHHVLVAGSTGSGKSTMLRTLITVAAMTYGPDELRFSLIDFRNGVGFEIFASGAHPLIHADAIITDCEREKGIHLLDGLIAEMRRRERVIRAATERRGMPIDDLAEYRRFTGEKLPRILVIADEFQVLTDGDDAIATEANRRLTMLAKQGRASGIHLLLASQTLLGSGLATDVRKQAVVRIGLKLDAINESEALFADGNTAAAAISETGKAIMNTSPLRAADTNRMFTVGLSDEDYMAAFLAGLRERGAGLPHTTRILDGTGPTEFLESMVLERVLRRSLRGGVGAPGGAGPGGAAGRAGEGPRLRHTFRKAGAAEAPVAGPVARLGTTSRVVLEVPVGMGDPTSLRAPEPTVVERVTGANLLHIGGGEAAAVGVAAGFLLSWVHACGSGDGPIVTVLDALRDADSATVRAGVERGAGSRIRWLRGRGIDAALVALEAERAARADEEHDSAPHLVMVLGLQRTNLRAPSPMAYGAEEEVTPRLAFERLITSGPRVGMHVAAWADTPTAATKLLSFEMRGDFGFVLAHRMDLSASEVLLGSRAATNLADGRAALKTPDGSVEVLSVLTPPDAATLARLLAKELGTR